MRLKYNINENGITLIALVITIVLLIILSTITINFAVGNGSIIDKAQGATQIAEQGDINEQVVFNTSMEAWGNIVDDPAEEAGIYKTTTKITDGLNNEITIPGGFRLADDSGTNVEDGIVIEDESGNQFVWIPVGEYNVSTEISVTGKLTNNLCRRVFNSDGAEEIPKDTAIEDDYYGEENNSSIVAWKIEDFMTSAENNGGFYIGRYEQGEGNVCKFGIEPYVNVTRNEALINAEVMCSTNYSVVSELISSYAWDTTLNFICQTNEEGYILSTTSDSTFANIGTNTKTKTGEYTADKYSNIYDFLGNCCEWTTEFNSDKNYSAVGRGGYFDGIYYAAHRFTGENSNSWSDTSFRVQLYVR